MIWFLWWCVTGLCGRPKPEQASFRTMVPPVNSVDELMDVATCFICFEGEGMGPTHVMPEGSRTGEGGEQNCQTGPTPEMQKHDGSLVSPCACRGSVAYVHVGCLKKWHLNLGNPTSLACPMCEQQYLGDMAEELARLNLERVQRQVCEHG